MATTTYGTPYVSGTDLVANWPAASLTVANSIDQAGYYVGRGTNTQTGSYTLVLTDAGKNITMALNTATTITIPTNSSVAFPIGTRVNIINLGSGACTPTAAGGVTIAGTITALAINEFASLVKTGTNTWSYLAGSTAAVVPGLSLITPTSVAGTGVSVSGGLVTFTAASAISVNGVFTATYQNYMVQYDVSAIAAGTPDINMRLRVSGTDNSTTSYTTQRIYSISTTVTSDANPSGTTTWNVGAGTSLLPDSGANVQIMRPQIAANTMFQSLQQWGAYVAICSGRFTAATQFDGFSLLPSASTLTGTLRVYGYRTS
jgi:hypothetical protein